MSGEGAPTASPAIERARIKFDFWGKVVHAATIPLAIASFWFPIRAVQGVFHEIAGKTTNFNVTWKVVATLSVALVGVGWAAIWKYLAQRGQLQRLRAVVTDLEGKNSALTRGKEESERDNERLRRELAEKRNGGK